jgi:hypothetical protein
VFIRIRGKLHYLWRAVDQDGHVLDILVQSRRNAKAAKRFFRKLQTLVSLCTSSSSIWKHWNLIAGGDMTRASFTPGGLYHRRRIQVGGTDLERRARNDLLGTKDTCFD